MRHEYLSTRCCYALSPRGLSIFGMGNILTEALCCRDTAVTKPLDQSCTPVDFCWITLRGHNCEYFFQKTEIAVNLEYENL